ncbi:MAG: hypothetical protein ACE5G8_13405 [Anaerolineae bacterium]
MGWFRLDVRDAEGRILAVTNPIFTGPRLQPAPVTYGDFVAGLT